MLLSSVREKVPGISVETVRLPGNASYVNSQRVALRDMIVKHCRKQIVSRAYGVKIAREV